MDEDQVVATPDYRETVWGVHPTTLGPLSVALRSNARASAPEAARAARPPATQGGVAVIPLKGLITPQPSFLSMLFGGGGGLQAFRAQLRDAVNAEDITAIILDVDSPGGSTDLIAEVAAELRAARTVKPLVAVANTWAASAAYWLAAQADELIVTPSGEVGSIGVYCAHEDISGFEDQLGIKTTLISAGKYKTEGNPYEPLSDEARQALQDKVDTYYAMFVSDVAKGRGVTASAVRAGYGEGRMLTADQAVAEKLADRVDTLDATITRLVTAPGKTRRRATSDAPTPSAGNPEPNPPTGGEEAPSVPSGAYIDLMFTP